MLEAPRQALGGGREGGHADRASAVGSERKRSICGSSHARNPHGRVFVAKTISLRRGDHAISTPYYDGHDHAPAETIGARPNPLSIRADAGAALHLQPRVHRLLDRAPHGEAGGSTTARDLPTRRRRM